MTIQNITLTLIVPILWQDILGARLTNRSLPLPIFVQFEEIGACLSSFLDVAVRGYLALLEYIVYALQQALIKDLLLLFSLLVDPVLLLLYGYLLLTHRLLLPLQLLNHFYVLRYLHGLLASQLARVDVGVVYQFL